MRGTRLRPRVRSAGRSRREGEPSPLAALALLLAPRGQVFPALPAIQDVHEKRRLVLAVHPVHEVVGEILDGAGIFRPDVEDLDPPTDRRVVGANPLLDDGARPGVPGFDGAHKPPDSPLPHRVTSSTNRAASCRRYSTSRRGIVFSR